MEGKHQDAGAGPAGPDGDEERAPEPAGDPDREAFLAMLGHELRNPLAPIRNALHLIKSRPLPLDRQTRWGIEVIDRQAGYLSRLVDALLDVGRMHCGALRLRRRAIVLAEVVRAALDTIAPAVEGRRHHLALDLTDEPLLVWADPDRLAQVVINLVDNASKYSDDGGCIEVGVARDADEAVVTVRDHGIGIAPAELSRIFEPFARLAGGAARAEHGLGLGLALVRSLVELHGGSVAVESDGPGRGSQFSIRLPVLRAEQILPPAAVSPLRPAPTRAGYRLLVVDDDLDAAETLAVLLRQLGHQVRTSHDGAGALAVARAFCPEVVVLDLGLPGLSGYELAERLRWEYGRSPLSLIAISGYGDAESRRRCHQAGIDHHVLKPADVDELAELIERAGAGLPPRTH